MQPEATASLPMPFNPWALAAEGDVAERTCTCCHEEWPLDSEFWYRESKNRDGFTTQCKACLQEKHPRKNQAMKVADPVVVSVTFSRKSCTSCHAEWPQDALHFRRDCHRPDGLSPQCKVCLKARGKAVVASKRTKREAARVHVHPDTRMRSFRV